MNKDRQARKERIREQIATIDRKISDLNKQRNTKKKLLEGLDREDVMDVLKDKNISSEELVRIVESFNRGEIPNLPECEGEGGGVDAEKICEAKDR